jgi:diguanylate cyclase (GGDEF)-like protein
MAKSPVPEAPRPEPSPADGPDLAHELAAAVRTIQTLRDETRHLVAELHALRAAQSAARDGADGVNHSVMREANEQLVLAAMKADAMADVVRSERDQLARSTQVDGLTGLPNRALMLDLLRTAISLAQRHGSRVAVLFIDLDLFKAVNDAMGHSAGDAVLQLAARELVAAVRQSDTVGRYGGDEFLVVLSDVKQAADAALIAEKIIARIEALHIPGNDSIRLSASIGISLYPIDGRNSQTLIAQSDAAMYRAKRQGGGAVEFHHQGAGSFDIPTDSAPFE